MKLVSKHAVKNILGQIPLTVEAYWYLRQPGKPVTPEFTLDQLEKMILESRAQVLASPYYKSLNKSDRSGKQKKIFIFGTLRYWIEHACLLSMALAGLGHSVTFAYMPFARWQEPIDPFNLRRQNLYAESVLSKANPLIKVIPLLNQGKIRRQPQELLEAVRIISLRDTQYTLQVEDVSLESNLYKLRLQRNGEAALATLSYLQRHKPDIVILPNGTILEFGAIYHVARGLKIPVVTYEFGEQRDRIWLAQNAEVMRQETNTLWERRKHQPLTEDQLTQVKKLFASRQRASLLGEFRPALAGVPSRGEQVRHTLNLDKRPVVLLATNLIESLTLGRQVFSDLMTEWLQRTVAYFASHSDVQLVIRIHPAN
jgi:hypothetical protein